jgi:hypothetical protein
VSTGNVQDADRFAGRGADGHDVVDDDSGDGLGDVDATGDVALAVGAGQAPDAASPTTPSPSGPVSSRVMVGRV